MTTPTNTIQRNSSFFANVKKAVSEVMEDKTTRRVTIVAIAAIAVGIPLLTLIGTQVIPLSTSLALGIAFPLVTGTTGTGAILGVAWNIALIKNIREKYQSLTGQ